MKCRRIWGEADTAIGKIVLDEINGRESVRTDDAHKKGQQAMEGRSQNNSKLDLRISRGRRISRCELDDLCRK
jgi:hypothetical protein